MIGWHKHQQPFTRVKSFSSFFITLITGTDINSAIQTGSTLLSDFLSSPEATEANHNSVSLIIFLTDGRPTVGELQTASILGNAQRAVGERFCVFTIGMGDDVDYRLLDGMALENCGTMRRIPEAADARTLLKGSARGTAGAWGGHVGVMGRS